MSDNPMLKRLIKGDDRSEFFHTSRYAKVQNGAGMGAASAEGFEQRMKVDRNRTRVKRYSESQIASQVNTGGRVAKTYDAKAFNVAREQRFGGGQAAIGRSGGNKK